MKCQGCNAELPPSPRGRPRKWCSERCRKDQYRGVCVDCGAPTSGSRGFNPPAHCRPCGSLLGASSTAAIRHEKRREQWLEIQRRWNAGETATEIGAALGMRSGTAQVTVTRMRAAGWDMSTHREGNAWRLRQAA